MLSLGSASILLAIADIPVGEAPAPRLEAGKYEVAAATAPHCLVPKLCLGTHLPETALYHSEKVRVRRLQIADSAIFDNSNLFRISRFDIRISQFHLPILENNPGHCLHCPVEVTGRTARRLSAITNSK